MKFEHGAVLRVEIDLDDVANQLNCLLFESCPDVLDERGLDGRRTTLIDGSGNGQRQLADGPVSGGDVTDAPQLLRAQRCGIPLGDEVFEKSEGTQAVSYTHLRAHETDSYLVCRLLLEKKK